MDGPIRRQLILLLSAYGYNLYDKKNRARADDLLVRERAAGAVAEAAGLLADLRAAYRRRFIPPPTRENPTPPPERMDALREIAAVQERLLALETHIRSQPVPSQDSVWERFRREEVLLNELLALDYGLIVPSQELRDRARAITVDAWGQEEADDLRRCAEQIERALWARAELLRA